MRIFIISIFLEIDLTLKIHINVFGSVFELIKEDIFFLFPNYTDISPNLSSFRYRFRPRSNFYFYTKNRISVHFNNIFQARVVLLGLVEGPRKNTKRERERVPREAWRRLEERPVTLDRD